METLRVPKTPCQVLVGLPGGESRTVSLFLSEYADNHPGRERIADLLNGPLHFLPALDENIGGITLLNRVGIAWVRVPFEEDPDPTSDHTLPHEHQVELTLVDGTVLRGIVSFVRPHGRSRLVDFLNEPIPFFRFLDPEGLLLVNRRHVALVAMKEES